MSSKKLEGIEKSNEKSNETSIERLNSESGGKQKKITSPTPKLEFTRNKRCFSESFKREKVQDLVNKRISVADFCKIYGISRTAAYNWIYAYSNMERGTRKVIEMESEAKKTLRALEKVAELERIVGQKQLTIDYLEKVLEVASKEVGYDLKKKYELKS